MKFLVEILNGSSFEIEVEHTDTLLEVKQKIEKSQRIPVSEQTLIVDGIVILREDLNVEQCQIVHDSRLQLDVSSGDNPIHNVDDQIPQTEPSPAPSIEEYFEGKNWPLTPQEISKIQDSPVTVGNSSNNNDQMQSPPSNSTGQIINAHQDSTVTVKVPQTEQSLPSNSVKEFTNIQESPVDMRNNIEVPKQRLTPLVVTYSGKSVFVNVNTTDQVKILRSELIQSQQIGRISLPQEEYLFMHKHKILNEDQSFAWNGVARLDRIKIVLKHVTRGSVTQKTLNVSMKVGNSSNNNDQMQSPPSNSTGQIINAHQDSTVRVKVPQTEQSLPSNSVKEFTNIQESPVDVRSNIEVPKQRLTPLVVTYSGKSVFVNVNTTDQVKILRSELVQSQQIGRISLPQEEYLFMHKHEVLNEDQSFVWNGVARLDRIEIVPKHVTRGSVTQSS